jgi:hypothetical protein
MIIKIDLRDDLPTLEKRRALKQIADLLQEMSTTITLLTRGSGEEVTLGERSGEVVARVVIT